MQKKLFDIPTRITHWTLAICVVVNLFITEEGSDIHDWVGYLAAALVVFRMTWRLSGRRFTHHNRLATLVYAAIWTSVIGLGITGWMMSLDRYWGDEWLEDLHENISVGLQILVGTHLLGIGIDSVRNRRAAWKAMITGVRPEPRSKV